jgi:hypothetical protein
MSRAGVPVARIYSAQVQAVRHCFTGEVRYSGPLSRVMPFGSEFVPVYHAHFPCAPLLRGEPSGGIARGERRCPARDPRPGLSTKPSIPSVRNRFTHL